MDSRGDSSSVHPATWYSEKYRAERMDPILPSALFGVAEILQTISTCNFMLMQMRGNLT